MQLVMVRRIIGLLLLIYSLSLLPPLAVSIYMNDQAAIAFMWPLIIMLIGGMALWYSDSRPLRELQARDGFIVIVVFWVVLGLVSALPFIFMPSPLPPASAFFEAVSGFTTTGATVITDLQALPTSILYYRQQLQLLGGLGVIVLAMSILPMLGIGGAQLHRAEAPGPLREEKFAPRLTQTAKALVKLYFGLTILCALAYYMAGMTPFEAVAHSYTTVSTSGFSIYDESMGYFHDTPLIEVIAIIFMLLGSLSFATHYMAAHKRSWSPYKKDAQAKVFLYMVLIITLITACVLWLYGVEENLDAGISAREFSFLEAFRAAAFQVVSLISTTGFTTESYNNWPLFLPVLVFGSGFIGGCVGSTAGGFRVIRIVLLYKQGIREILRLIHPNAVVPLRVGGRVMSERTIESILGFTFLYMASYIFLSLMMMAAGSEIVEAFAATAACINTIGPGLGKVANNFSEISDAGLIISSFAMILGRLEIFALLVVLTPTFWYR